MRLLHFSALFLLVAACGGGEITPSVDGGIEDSGPADVSQDVPGSDDASPDVATDVGSDVSPDVGPTLPFSVTTEIEPVWVETLDETPADWVAIGGKGSAVLAGDDIGLWRIDEEGVTELAAKPSFDPQTVTDAVGLPDGRFLVAAAGGIFLVDDVGIALSPLSTYFTDATVLKLAADAEEDDLTLWIAASDGLSMWRDDTLLTIVPEGLGAAGALLAVDNGGTLWVASEGDVYRIEETDDGFEAWAEQSSLPAQGLGVDADGNVWIESEETLHLRTPNGIWFDLSEFEPFRAATSRKSEHVWLRAQDALWHLHGGTLRPTDAPLGGGDGEMDPLGMLVMATEDGVFRINPGRSVQLEGLPEGSVLASSAILTVKVDSPELVTSVDVNVNGVPQTLSEDWSFTIDAEEIGAGSHTIDVDVTYSDLATPTNASFAFTVMLPTWEGDIQPLADAACGGCHGEKAPLDVKFYTKDQWQSSFDLIVVKTAGTDAVGPAMPPGEPLDPEPTQLIQYWGEAGFL